MDVSNAARQFRGGATLKLIRLSSFPWRKLANASEWQHAGSNPRRGRHVCRRSKSQLASNGGMESRLQEDTPMDDRPNLPTVPADVSNDLKQSSLFGPPPLFKGEDAAAYDELHAHISAAVKPKDFLEQIWVRDVVDLTWETLRMRRLRAELLSSKMQDKIRYNMKRARNLSKRWAARDPQAIERVNKWLASIGTTAERLTAEHCMGMIDTFERFDRIVTNIEVRRNAALREIERHRTSIAHAVRRASDEFLDAEFEDVAPDQRTQKKVA
jgi:hypothetical protein